VKIQVTFNHSNFRNNGLRFEGRQGYDRIIFQNGQRIPLGEVPSKKTGFCALLFLNTPGTAFSQAVESDKIEGPFLQAFPFDNPANSLEYKRSNVTIYFDQIQSSLKEISCYGVAVASELAPEPLVKDISSSLGLNAASVKAFARE
jgi:hypothetical protein